MIFSAYTLYIVNFNVFNYIIKISVEIKNQNPSFFLNKIIIKELIKGKFFSLKFDYSYIYLI